MEKERSGFELDNGTSGVSASTVSLQKESGWEKNLEGELCAYLGAMNMLGVMDGETTDGAIRLRDESIEKIMKSVRKRIAKSLSSREKEIAEEVKKKVGLMRQWLNEDRITDNNKMVTSEELLHWLKH